MHDPGTPADQIYLEDIEIGRLVPFGRKMVSKEDIIRFALAYDPQPMHIDEEAAKKSIVGGLCASGFHSCAIFMRMLADGLLTRWTSLGSPGIDECKWMKPLRPDQELTARYLCTEKRAMASRPHVGIAKVRFEMLDSAGDVIMSWDGNQLLKVRNPGGPGVDAGQSSGSAVREPLANLWEEPAGPAPDPTRNFYEDRNVGEVYELGAHTFTREEIIAFAREFDPQPFHLDEEAAKASLFGGLSASGWHTAAIWIRQFVAYRQRIEAQIRASGNPVAQYGPSPGFRNLRWLKPVFPGDTITFRGRTAAKIDLKSRPDRGLLQTDSQGRNQKGEVVFNIRGQILAERREPYRP